jgi:hypothetical protein
MRVWKSAEEDDGSIHVLGNGKLCVYEQGPNIIQMFGRPYSSPSFLSMSVSGEKLEVHSERTEGTAIWHHTIFRDGTLIGAAVDFVDSESPCFIRKVTATERIEFDLKIHPNAFKADNSEYYHLPSVFIRLDRGEKIYGSYPTVERSYHQINCKGAAKCDFDTITCNPGVSELIFSGDPIHNDCVLTAESAINGGFEALLRRTRKWWDGFASERRDFGSMIPNDLPLRKELLEATDSVSVLIKAQQSDEGGILAGYAYHLAYVRDMYGDFRALLYLGYIKEARKVIRYCFDVWRKFGKVCNAQGMGIDGLFHIHENDRSEITGYLVLQAFDFLEATGEDEFIESVFPMLEWAFESQTGELRNGMMPFNGDETYVAGGIMPRSALQDGSAEATMLFIRSGELLLDWIGKHEKWSSDRIRKAREIIASVRNDFRTHFMDGNTLLANNPERLARKDYARFKKGICEGCGTLEFLEQNANHRYLCPKCYLVKTLDAAEPVRYNVRSVSLFPGFIGSDLIAEDEIRFMIDGIIAQYRSTGSLPSRPDGSRAVGYDYGFLLNTLTMIGHDAAEEIYRLTLSVLDSTGAWVEYYDGGKPQRTRCRPWESGINIEACLKFAVSHSRID